MKEKILCRQETQASSKVEGLRLMNGPTIQGHGVQHSDAHCLLIIDAILVPCTPTEYALLMSLFNEYERFVPFSTLVQQAFHSPLNEHTRHSLTQHISRVRSKLWPFGLDIFCLTGYGYLLQATLSTSAEREPETPRVPT